MTHPEGAPPLILLVGPTASGKTDVSIALAEAIGAEIVCADSRQLYRGLDIGTGKPTAAQRARVPHHLIDRLEPHEVANAASFAREARAAIESIRARGRHALVVGGSGLYVRALLQGLFEGPGRDEALRARIRARAAERGWPALYDEVAARDPAAAGRIHPNDAVRITRALEIMQATGLTATEARRAGATPPLALAHRAFAIEWPRAALADRIASRFHAMIAAGLVDEVRGLLARGIARNAPAFDSPGYREIVAHTLGEMSLDEATAQAITATRQYAKRQMTWFRRLRDLTWVPGDENAVAPADAIHRSLAGHCS
jgi:tRNA dimethylallyltransferase